ncbi:Bacterial alpha-L-rhamnosidase [Nocardioides sp. BGMRC 2183]|nr:Bacterial alpha-L-rhamnosidase [Nocardioides sp. BGMRC 2183]
MSAFRVLRTHVSVGIALFLVVSMAALVQVAAAPSAGAAEGDIAVETMTTNGRIDPLGIPGSAPSFGWASVAEGRDVVQSAYQIRVATSEADLESADVWDSGKVASDRQVDVVYGGDALQAGARYHWQVRVWDGDDNASEWSEAAWFETGLLAAEDWGAAEWIGADAGAELDRWTDYTAEFDFTMDNLVFGPYVRARNTSNGYMWQLSVADGTPRLRPHVKSNGGFSLLANKDISEFVTLDELRTGEHTLAVTFDGATITTELDGVTIDARTDPTHQKGYVGFRSTNATEGVEASTVHAVRVVAENGDTLLDTDFSDGNPFSGGTLVDDGLEVKGQQEIIWRSPDDNMPLLRTDFSTESDKSVASARVYATARGIYELTLNGEKVGDQHMAPGWTDYRDRFQHQTYDVTDLVTDGENTFGAELGSGWWAGRVAHLGTGNYGTQTSVLTRLRITYTDGTTQWVDSDGETWTASTGGHTLADLIDGESYDARLAKDGWNEPGYDDTAWSAAVTRTAPTAPVVPQPDEPVRTTQELPTLERTEPAPGRWTYDVGQNMVGVARMELTGEAGDTVTIRYGEELNPDGTLYTDNLRSAKVTDRYTFAEDGTVTYEPTFTQHGFRYLEIVGTTTPPETADVTGVVWGSDLAETGTLETSDDMLNQLLSNISWGQRGNFVSIPTDTPARDERLGWSGDINVFAPTASYLTDTRAFLGKWMRDMHDTQGSNGDYPGVAPSTPTFSAGGGVGWSDAGITVPYAIFRAYGDASVAREFWDDLTRFFEHTRNSAGADLIDDGRTTYGDWLNLDDPTPGAVLGTAYLAENARMMAEMATALGKDGEAAEYAALSEQVRERFTATQVAADGRVNGNSQTAYAMALGMDMITDEELRTKAGERFVAKLAASDNHLTTGFLGTPWLLPALSSIDRDDLAYTMLLHQDYPSWGYEVANGATTMWERWNSIMPDGSFGDVSMNSFNHYAYGAVGDWMYQNIGAISALQPGYKTSRIAPNVGGGLDHASGSLESVYGEIATEWSAEGDDLDLHVEVPVNTTAEVVLPAENQWAVTEGGALLDAVEGVHDVTTEDDTVTVTVGSGSYDFAVTAASGELGEILDLIAVAQETVTAQADAGDLGDADATHLTSGIDGVREEVVAAIGAVVAEDDEERTERVQAALAQTQELRTWLAGSGVDRPVRSVVDRDLVAVEAALGGGVADALGLVTGLAPIAEAALPGTAVAGTLDLTNEGTATVSDISATVEVEGWEPVEVTVQELAAGAAAQLPVTATVPRGAKPGGYDADLTLRFTVDGTEYVVEDTTQDWVTVTSGVSVGEATASLTGPDPAEAGTIEVPVSNDGDRPVRVTVGAELENGWGSVPSAEVEVPAGGEATATVPITVPLDRIAGAVEATLTVDRAGVRLASAKQAVDIALPTPPTTEAVDHVDFGDSASEQAHALQASPSSGTSTEAGYTRRYSHANNPGSWYSVELAVPTDAPFVLRHIETYDGARTKKYEVYLDDQLVKTQIVPRAESGAGIKVHDILVDDPALFSEDGSVRVKYQYPAEGASGFHDPSLADVWVLPVAADATAPLVAATVVDGVPGQQGWYRSPVQIAVDAADGRDPAPVAEYGFEDGWSPVDGLIAVADEGEHTLSFRAIDVAGNRSTVGELPVRIDLTAPSTTVGVVRGNGVDGSDRAELRFEGSDELSGVAATSYRIDGGDWLSATQAPVVVEGYGDHVVEYASTDLAGNVEPVRRTVVTLADVDELVPVVAPQVAGTARFGSTLEADGGSWNTKGVALAYQWLRDGKPIAGATGMSYRLKKADIDHRVTVQVTASKDGFDPVSVDAPATPNIAKARATVAASVTKVRGGKARITARVSAGVKVTGRVLIKAGGKVVARAKLRNGGLTRTVKLQGRKKVAVRYLGSATVAPTSTTIRVRNR